MDAAIQKVRNNNPEIRAKYTPEEWAALVYANPEVNPRILASLVPSEVVIPMASSESDAPNEDSFRYAAYRDIRKVLQLSPSIIYFCAGNLEFSAHILAG